MKCEILKRTAIALFVGGIVSASATAEDTSVEAAGSSFGKAINTEITKQTEAVKSEVTEKITKQDEKIKKINKNLSGVAANSYNNTLTLNGFKAGDTVYDVNTDTNEVTPKKATEEDVKNDPLEGKGIVATVVKNKDSIEDLSEDLDKTDENVERLAGDVKKNREDLISANTQFEKLDKEVSELTTAMDSVTGEGGLYDIVKKHKEIIDGDGSPDSGLVHVVDKHSEIINDLKRYNHLDDVKALVENKADKQALEALKEEVSTNSEAITSVSDQVEENHNSIENVREEHYNLVSDVKKFVEDYNKFADDTNKELDEKANASEVYTKTESDSKLDAKANVSDVYTKTESDSKLDAKANASDVYTKTESDSKLNAKANASDVYTKTESDSKLNAKANASEVYTKTESDSKLDAKANASDVYTKTESDSKLNAKANASDVYTKTESDRKLNAKANVADVYSKTETDNKFALKADNSVVRAQAADIRNLRTDVNAHTKRLDHLDNRVNKLDKDLKRGLAAQAALTGLFQPYTVGKANFTAAVGGYKSQTAVAIGTGYRYNQNIATKAGVAFTQGGGVTYNAGVNFEW